MSCRQRSSRAACVFDMSPVSATGRRPPSGVHLMLTHHVPEPRLTTGTQGTKLQVGYSLPKPRLLRIILLVSDSTEGHRPPPVNSATQFRQTDSDRGSFRVPNVRLPSGKSHAKVRSSEGLVKALGAMLGT